MEFKFKTDINCEGCVKGVSGFINELPSVENWKVDTANPEKILTVSGENITASSIIEVVEEAGFDIELLN